VSASVALGTTTSATWTVTTRNALSCNGGALGLKVFLVADKAVFEVQDDGCGIPEEKLKSVFYGSHEAYEVSSDCKRSNAGIGLAVCATIIKAHGGKIKAENKKNGGALFRFYLDMEEKEQA
jgi:two-component system sensor histidine kinase KdpD